MRYLLDTNTVSFLLRGHPSVVERVTGMPMADLCLSAVTEAELEYGLGRRPAATRLREAIHQLLLRIEVLPWDRLAAKHYGALRAQLGRSERGLSALDLMIAAHARSIQASLVSNDGAFLELPELAVQDWSR